MLFRDQLLHDGIFNGVAHSFGLFGFYFFSRSLLFFSDSKFFRNVFQAVVKLASYTISITLFTLIQSWSHETSQNGSWHHMKVLNLTLLTTTIITTTSRQQQYHHHRQSQKIKENRKISVKHFTEKWWKHISFCAGLDAF